MKKILNVACVVIAAPIALALLPAFLMLAVVAMVGRGLELIGDPIMDRLARMFR